MSISNILLISWFFILTVITSLLVCEYRYFKEQANLLGQLKDDYSAYILSLKKLINEQKSDQELETQDQKKKANFKDIEPQNFILINRESRYLKRAAISFAKRHKLERAIIKLYSSQDFIVSDNVDNLKFSKKNKGNKKAKNKRNLNKILQRESIFAWPIDKRLFRLSSLFGPRKHPRGSWEFHKGIDLAASRGTPVNAAQSGVIIEAGYVAGYGNTIRIAHDKKYKTRYAHLSSICVNIGQRVEKFDQIGKVGSTGNVRTSRPGGQGSHLHFEVYVFDKQVNPLYFLS